MDDDDEEDDEAIMEDELFRRIMNHANRKSVHAYRLSYAEDVGSSFDPDMEDVEAWERELREAEENIPDDMTDEEIAAYAEEQAALADLQGLDIDAFLDMEPFEGMDIDTLP
ncbi:hypothetical protein ONZ45_g6007 [Pleurotus djamor]|nr:hypothetical protein ONZ45_g6007 [Pleurotus djamor]